jgi:hypothetical protein
MNKLIYDVLELVRDFTDTALRQQDPRDDHWVILSNLVNHDGSPALNTDNKVVLTLAGLEQERLVSTYARGGNDDVFQVVGPPVYLDLLVVFYANFSGREYASGLNAIASIIALFQKNPMFGAQGPLRLPQSMDKLSVQLQSPTNGELTALLDRLGVKYLPMVCYKLRVLTFS